MKINHFPSLLPLKFNLRTKVQILILFNLISLNAISQYKNVYEFPSAVQKLVQDKIKLEKIDSLDVCYLMLSSFKDYESLSFYCIKLDYNDSLITLINDKCLGANICGKTYPLILFSDFLYSTKLNYQKEKTSNFVTNVMLPHSSFDVSFNGQAYEEGEIIE